ACASKADGAELCRVKQCGIKQCGDIRCTNVSTPTRTSNADGIAMRTAMNHVSRRRCTCPWRQRFKQCGQSAVEYLLVVSVLLSGLWGAGLFGDQGGLLALLLDALRGFHHRFTT